jgi:hypothetical protein
LSTYLLYFAKCFSTDSYFMIELHIRGVSMAYPNGVQALKDVQIRAGAGLGFPHTLNGGFECSD